MNLREIESWALRVIEQVDGNQPSEDFFVELKGRWMAEPDRAARRIAGHANAARGEPILWLIGIDQENGVQGASHNELATWWPQVQGYFDGPSPPMRDVNITWNDRTVVALLFSTERAPFVVRNPAFGQPNGGPVQREVPWREGTATRSATHNDLVLLLMPLQRVPYSEVTSAAVTLIQDQCRTNHIWTLDLKMFVNPAIGERLVLLHNRCYGSFEVPTHVARTDLANWRITSVAGQQAAQIENGFTLEAPSVIRLRADGRAPMLDMLGTEVQVTVNILPVGAERPITVETTLTEGEAIRNSLKTWLMSGGPPPWDTGRT